MSMNVIRVNYLPRFDYGHDAVLLTLDGPGLDTFRAALTEAMQRGSSRLEHDGVTHDFVISAGAADITLTPTHVSWRLDPAKADEIALDLAVLSEKGRAGHNYVDMSTPAPTLVVSRDEYLAVTYPWINPPAQNQGTRT
ncbi:hypothetical protein K883_05371 [Mycobacterium sp. TKK-01-0059]|uniref:hypothetical protein n=1 Tax=Mycobacterium sp. TKK-01-0059 TaxID=1324269 RepID=UPI0004D6F011|nr:hypothetical protein [Mycobacterium sp. TKK-01-0059]KEF94947.1 hypothetical protein K883_05371 [Mycobacterium sp. TKK-01-0059]